MRAIIIPLLIIAILVGFYYAGDFWKSIKTSVPFIGDKELELQDSKEKFIPPASPGSPLKILK